ncbi:unnamed protein product, partial [Ectocarpus sp. 12 AP-2014]
AYPKLFTYEIERRGRREEAAGDSARVLRTVSGGRGTALVCAYRRKGTRSLQASQGSLSLTTNNPCGGDNQGAWPIQDLKCCNGYLWVVRGVELVAYQQHETHFSFESVPHSCYGHRAVVKASAGACRRLRRPARRA